MVWKDERMRDEQKKEIILRNTLLARTIEGQIKRSQVSGHYTALRVLHVALHPNSNRGII